MENLTLNYAYVNQVNRIFGSEAHNPLPNASDVGADVHLINASFRGVEGWTLGAYAYLMRFDKLRGWNNKTFGLSAATEAGGCHWHGEAAWQDNSVGGRAWYAHGKVSRTFGGHTLTLGLEFLDAGFRTPLATLHAFNGFADVFVAGRTGGAHGGLTNPYLMHSMQACWDMKWTNVLHAFGDNALDAGYGWEYDTVLSKTFSGNLTVLGKLAFFESGGSGRRVPTTARASVELGYIF